MIRQDEPADPDVHALAVGLARQCRHIVQGCLREEEWIDADREFYMVIREGLERLAALRRIGSPFPFA